MQLLKYLSCLFLLVFLTGCWDRREVAEISIVTGMAVDKGEAFKYKLTIETTEAREMNPKTATGFASANISWLEGNNIGELSQKFNIVNATHPIYSHTRVLVVSEEIVEEGLLEFMDWFDRNREIRDDFAIIVARGSNGLSTLNQTAFLRDDRL